MRDWGDFILKKKLKQFIYQMSFMNH